MNNRNLSWLMVLTAVVVLIAVLMPGEPAHQGGVTQKKLLPGLAAQANDVDWLRIRAGGEVVATASRRDGAWVIEEASGYRADWPRLQQLLSALAAATVMETKTDNPDYYERLGVDDPSTPGAGGVGVEFAESTGLPAVIVGNPARGRDGQYARLADSAQSVLIDRQLDLPNTGEEWLEREVADISDNEVVEVEITHPDGETVKALKVSADDEDFTLQDVAEGFEPNSNWSVNSLAGGLSSLQLDAVVPVSEIDWSNAIHYRVLTADGLDVEAEVAATAAEEEGMEPEYWLRLQAGVRTTSVEDAVDEEAAAATTERAEAINRRVSGWAYRVPKYKFETMGKRKDDLVRPVAKDG